MSTTVQAPLPDRRIRLLDAFSKAGAEGGYAELDLNTVVRYAGLGLADFDREFRTKERALLAAQEAFFDRLWTDALAAAATSVEWPAKVRAGLGAVLASLVESGARARLFTVEAPAVSLAAAERQFALLDRFAALLRQGRHHYPRAATMPESTERLLVIGVAALVSQRLLREERAATPDFEAELAELLLIPYLGRGQARRIAKVAPDR